VSVRPLLAVVPARGGSKGLPGKNIRPLAGLPLLMHSVLCARMCPVVDRIVVSTDSETIADTTRRHGTEVICRPAALAADDTPMWPVIQHTLSAVEGSDARRYAAVLLLDPTSPGRLPSDIVEALAVLERSPECDGVVGVSVPEFNPYWHCVVEESGYMRDLFPAAAEYKRRQDVPPVYRINATLYCWWRDFVLSASTWRRGRLKMQVVPEERSVHIDTTEQFELTDLRVRHGLLQFPWLDSAAPIKPAPQPS
jgi:N-acylneuraminate cytidylyltransferase